MSGNTPTVADLLKQAMRGLASSVAIVSASTREGERNAMTATSITSLSLDPPSMLVCVNRSASLHKTLVENVDFCINILAVDHLPIANLCAGGARGEDRFGQGDWQTDADGVPYLADAQAAIICKQVKRIGHGSHDILIGDVKAIHLAPNTAPLVYAEGAYKRLAPL